LIGQSATFIALNTGQISVVAPVIKTTRLFAIALTALACAAKRKLTASN
jgi:uncharacterized membrane protein